MKEESSLKQHIFVLHGRKLLLFPGLQHDVNAFYSLKI